MVAMRLPRLPWTRPAYLADRPLAPDPAQQSGIFLRPSPLWSRVLLWVLSGGASLTLVWSCLATYESTSVFSGQLQTVRGELQLKSSDDGFVSIANTGSHRFFRKSAVIFAFSSLEQRSQIDSLSRRIQLISELERSIESSFRARQRQLQRRIALLADLVARYESIQGMGAIPEIQILERKAELEDSIASLEGLVSEKTSNLHNAAMEKNTAIAQLQQLRRSLPRLIVRAPSDGYLLNAPHRSTGDRVQAGEVLATFVPVEPLQAVVQVPTRLSRPLAVGEPVELSIDAFPSADYGFLKARVQSIAPTAVSSSEPQAAPSFNVKIAISTPLPSTSRIRFADLRSGMAVQARITTDRRPVISMVFDFLNGLTRTMGESR